mmetsp:Transcript_23019/g.55785  ORF Transcript_23019/g.55785 Transcript_23019/m.55785 type:complete len:111 (-) Transcript_23019:9-341(-)
MRRFGYSCSPFPIGHYNIPRAVLDSRTHREGEVHSPPADMVSDTARDMALEMSLEMALEMLLEVSERVLDMTLLALMSLSTLRQHPRDARSCVIPIAHCNPAGESRSRCN